MKTLITLLAMTSLCAAEPVGTHWDAPNGTRVLYRFASPENIEEGKNYPLILFLHGSGERGSDNNAQVKHGVKQILGNAAKLDQPVFLIAPQCPKDRWWADPAEGRVHLADAGGDNPLLDAVLALVEKTAGKHPVDRNRIYLTGLSMGGFGSWDLLTRAPDTFAAAIPICGGGDPDQAEKFKDIPIRIYHGTADEVVPVAASQTMADALEQAGSKAKLILYPDVGHDSWTRTYSDPEVVEWLFNQRKAD